MEYSSFKLEHIVDRKSRDVDISFCKYNFNTASGFQVELLGYMQAAYSIL